MTVSPRFRLCLLAFILCAACSKPTTLSTEDIIGEWVKPGQKLPPVSLLISAEGPGLRARLRLSGTERAASAKVTGTKLRLRFEQPLSTLEGQFLSKTQLEIRLKPDGEIYRLQKRP